ncbi:MAG: flagellar basal body rod C-terminal domain-containing protein, partial [Planctomycetota bacterium]|nr:flagellar basal body rod C-terminal domain-containing protein [Planctomycetota bacterium]
RAGNFTVSPAGRLVTADMKYEVVNSEGGVFAITSPQEVTIAPDGEVSQRGEVIGRLSIVSFARPDGTYGLRKVGDNVLEDLGQAGRQAAQVRVQQGALEMSNVNPVVEMSKMIMALRAYEANIQLMKSHDSILDRTVNDIGRPV